MSLYSGDWSEYRETMCVCPKCICDEEASNDDDIKKAFSDEINE